MSTTSVKTTKLVHFLLDPRRNKKVWAVMLPDGKLLMDILSVNRATYCIKENIPLWLSPFYESFSWRVVVSEPYEADMVLFKEEARKYLCIFGLDDTSLRFMDVDLSNGDLIFFDNELASKLDDESVIKFKKLMTELWKYVKERTDVG